MADTIHTRKETSMAGRGLEFEGKAPMVFVEEVNKTAPVEGDEQLLDASRLEQFERKQRCVYYGS